MSREDLLPGDRPVPCKWVFKRGPLVRARAVVCEVKSFAPHASEFAATPPLEALRILISMAASDSGLFLDFIDVRKAHLNGAVRRRVVIRLPKDMGGGFGLLRRAMYGTRDAAAAWNDCIQAAMGELGFTPGATSPCIFWHPTDRVRALVHGDDFVLLGALTHLDRLREEFRQRWLIKERGVLGRDPSEITILNRILRRTGGGYELEADPKHVRLLVESLDLPLGPKEWAPLVSTPPGLITTRPWRPARSRPSGP